MNIGVVSLYMAGEIVVRKPFRLTLEDSLSILIVPVALAGVGYLLTWWQKNRDLAVEAQRLKNSQELEQQRAQDEVFQAYLDQLTGTAHQWAVAQSGALRLCPGASTCAHSRGVVEIGPKPQEESLAIGSTPG
jgi:hypothetical protein